MYCTTAKRCSIALALACLACASSAQVGTAPTPSLSANQNHTIEQRVETIQHEDAGSRINELRIGGQTKHIHVTTKSGMPAYQIQPVDAGASATGQLNTGKSSWRLVNF